MRRNVQELGVGWFLCCFFLLFGGREMMGSDLGLEVESGSRQSVKCKIKKYQQKIPLAVLQFSVWVLHNFVLLLFEKLAARQAQAAGYIGLYRSQKERPVRPSQECASECEDSPKLHGSQMMRVLEFWWPNQLWIVFSDCSSAKGLNDPSGLRTRHSLFFYVWHNFWNFKWNLLSTLWISFRLWKILIRYRLLQSILQSGFAATLLWQWLLSLSSNKSNRKYNNSIVVVRSQLAGIEPAWRWTAGCFQTSAVWLPDWLRCLKRIWP